MLCPEVWNFKAPESNFQIKNHQIDQCNYSTTTNSFIFNHLVSVIIPDTFKVPESLTEALVNDCDYYRVDDVKLDEFISKTFINSFVNIGNLYVLSVGTRIDCDNCLAITPNGKLILNLDKSSYQKLGIEGAVSHFHAKTQERYVVTIDLKQSFFKPGKPNYEHTKKCLGNLQEKFKIIINWEPPSEDICPSTIAKYFNDKGYWIKDCQIQKMMKILYSVKSPPNIEEKMVDDFVEWLGMVAVDADLENGGPQNYVNSYDLTDSNERIGQVKFFQWRGFFSCGQIDKFIQQLRDFYKSSTCPWISLYVQGFSDSPIAWGAKEHHFYTNGDNGYVIIFKKNELILATQKCSQKQYINKRKNALY